MPNSHHSGKMPGGHPSFTELQQEFLTPQVFAFIRESPQRISFVKDLSAHLARDPVLLSNVEAMLRENKRADMERIEISESQIASFGWSQSPELPGPKKAAAAVAAAAAAMSAAAPTSEFGHRTDIGSGA
jgi:hypothetical protein